MDDRCVEILNEQNQDEIDVIIVWKQDLPTSDLIQDFIMYDGSVVQIKSATSAGIYEGVTVTKVPKKVQIYEQKFKTIKRCGQRFEEFMEALNIIKSNEK